MDNSDDETIESDVKEDSKYGKVDSDNECDAVSGNRRLNSQSAIYQISEDTTRSRSESRSRSRSPISTQKAKYKKTRNPFINFVQEFRQGYTGTKCTDIAQQAAKKWKCLSPEEKQPYVDQANIVKEQKKRLNNLNKQGSTIQVKNLNGPQSHTRKRKSKKSTVSKKIEENNTNIYSEIARPKIEVLIKTVDDSDESSQTSICSDIIVHQ